MLTISGKGKQQHTTINTTPTRNNYMKHVNIKFTTINIKLTITC